MEALEKVRVHTRWVIKRDLPEILEIENASFAVPWVEEDFLRCLRNRNCIGMVAEHGAYGHELVIGYTLYELHRDRIHLLSFAVLPAWRRQGVGEQMIEKLARKLCGHGRNRLTIEVRETNLEAQLFFRKVGFLATRVIPGHYEDTGEDGFRMVRRFCD